MKIIKASVLPKEDMYEGEVVLQSNGLSHTGVSLATDAESAIRYALREASDCFLRPLLDSVKVSISVDF